MARKRGERIHGWLVLDKPLDLTSTKAVGIVRRIFNAQKAGHAGTLDPLASGILPIALGEATKTVNYVMEGGKEYEFTVKWGAETSTDDLEGEVTSTSLKRPTLEEVEEVLTLFIGNILQTPPAYSAIKINGKRAYDLARSGEEVEIASREVRIDDLIVKSHIEDEEMTLVAKCGKGTYIRALARDIGRELGCLGHVTRLRRIKSGPFTENMSISLEKLEELSHSAAARDELLDQLCPIETALDDIPALAINEDDASRVRLGQAVLLKGRDAPIIKGPAYAMSGQQVVALGSVSQGEFKPSRVIVLDA